MVLRSSPPGGLVTAPDGHWGRDRAAALHVVATLPEFELRRYDDCVVEVEVGGSMDTAGNRAFRRFVGHIGGRNRTRRSLAMTAPVMPEKQGDRHVVGFVMPAGETL